MKKMQLADLCVKSFVTKETKGLKGGGATYLGCSVYPCTETCPSNDCTDVFCDTLFDCTTHKEW